MNDVEPKRGPFTERELASRWQNGECGTYARALQLSRPELELRIGALGNLDAPGDSDSDFDVHHFVAHDDKYAYDSLGRHELPYLGVNNQFNHAVLDCNAGHWGCVEDEHGDEGGPEAQHALKDAGRYIRRRGILAATATL